MHGALRGVGPLPVVGLIWLANLLGALMLAAEYLVVFPFPPAEHTDEVIRGNLLLAAGLLVASWVVLLLVGAPLTHRALDWTTEERDPTAPEQRRTLAMPWRLFLMQVTIWAASCLVMFVHNLSVTTSYAAQVAGAVIIGGLVTATLAYLLATRLLRPVTARVLELSPPRRGESAGVGERSVFVWALTTGAPILGLVVMIGFAGENGVSLSRLALSGVVVGLVALAGGLFAAVLFAKSLGEPLGELSGALAEVESGRLDVAVAVDDAGEIGQLQAGLNRMVGALQEREQLRDLFGRHVGEHVARLALDQGVELGGEEREAAALFVDVIGSTTYAAQRSPSEVVSALNRFFEVVVEVVDAHGGLVNKFEGDAALCIFGAPLELPDPAGSALAAAREMAVRLRARVPDLDAGIGVSHGLVVAGNVGATNRLEYTVIGDPVNEAARLTEQAKDRPERVVASQRIVDRAASAERDRWRLLDPVTLRGRPEATVLAVPA